MLLRPMRKYAAAGAVAASLVLVAPAANAVTPPAISDGTTWLAAQLTNGIVHDDQYGFDDYGTSIDISLALQTTGSDDLTAVAIRDAVATHITSYIDGDQYDPGAVYANAVAKAAYLAGASAGDFGPGHENLLADLDAVTDAGTGAINDHASVYGNYGNTIGQAYAVRVLTANASPKAAAATQWMLHQQCPNGGFALNMGQTSSQCTANSDADPDVTSYVLILNAAASQSNAALARAVGKAEGWLLARQHADGSFNGGSSTDTPNANSTGLAGWALGTLGDTGAAQAAAVWIRQHQVQTVASCSSQLDGEDGAIAYDNTALATGRVAGINLTVAGQWRSASSQALPSLQWAPTGTSTPVLTAPTTYVAAGGSATVHASGITPGTWVCGSVGSSHVPGAAGIAGTAALKVKVPAGTGNRTVTLTASDGTSTTAQLKALAAKALAVAVTKATVAHGGSQTVKATGLASHEPVKVIYNGKVIKTGTASASGTFTLTFPVGSTTGTRTVKVQGAFGNRVGSKSFKVS